MVIRKHFWKQTFGICEKYEVNYTAIWSQNNTKMTAFGHWCLSHCFRLPEIFFSLKGAGGPDLGISKIEFSIVHDRGEPQLPDTFYCIKKY